MTPAPVLEDLLDQITDALQRGALVDLAALSRAIEDEVAILPKLDSRRADALRLRVARNDLCLQAAARGVRAAIARIAGIGGQAPQLSTYSADGRRVLVGEAPAHHSQRL